MATKSILKTIVIKDSSTAGKLAKAMDRAMEKVSKEVLISHKVSEASRDEIKTLFGISEK